jgi:hypothetical protein
MSELVNCHFFFSSSDINYDSVQMLHPPRVGDVCRICGSRYKVVDVEWCLDDDAPAHYPNVNVTLESAVPFYTDTVTREVVPNA